MWLLYSVATELFTSFWMSVSSLVNKDLGVWKINSGVWGVCVHFFEGRGCWWCVFAVFLFVLVGLVFNEDCKIHDSDRPEG